MVKCWMVTQGEYSAYHVVGVFSSEDNAKKACEFVRGDDECSWSGPAPEVSEIVLDPCVAELNAGLMRYEVEFRQGLYQGAAVRIFTDRSLTAASDSSSPYGHYYVVWAREEDHALKIAAERHAAKLCVGLDEIEKVVAKAKMSWQEEPPL